MTWARFDDGFADHPKIEGLSDAGFRLHVSAVVFCARTESDGHLPGPRVARLVPRFKPAHLAELLEAGVWHAPGHGCSCPQPLKAGDFYVHDFLVYHATKADNVKRRGEAAERQRRARERKEADKKAARDKERESQRDSTRDQHRESQRPAPTRPDLPPTEVREAGGTPAAPASPETIPPAVVAANLAGIKAARGQLKAVGP